MVKAIKVMLIPNNVQKTKCFSTQELQDLLITGLWPGKKKTMKRVASSFQIQN